MSLYEKLLAKAKAHAEARKQDQDYDWKPHAFGISRKGIAGGTIVIYTLG